MNKPKLFFKIMILILIFIILVVVGRYYIGRNLIRNSELTELSCNLWGGSWRTFGGKSQIASCYVVFNDIGKSCTDGSQCDSKFCITQSDIKSATCSVAHGGCYGLVNDGSVEQICVD